MSELQLRTSPVRADVNVWRHPDSEMFAPGKWVVIEAIDWTMNTKIRLLLNEADCDNFIARIKEQLER